MGTSYLDRRQLLKGLGVGALAAGAAAALSPTTALADNEEKGVVGTWDFTAHPTNSPSFVGVISFAPGGVAVELDANSAGTTQGVWRHQEGNKFLFKIKGFDFMLTPPGVLVVSGDLTLSGNSIRGTFTATENGNLLASGTIDGTRMTV